MHPELVNAIGRWAFIHLRHLKWSFDRHFLSLKTPHRNKMTAMITHSGTAISSPTRMPLNVASPPRR